MRTGGLPLAALLLVIASTVLQVSLAGDIYLEGEEDAANEYLEVKEDESSIYDHPTRFKRQSWLNPFSLFGNSEKEAEDVTESVGTDDSPGDVKDDDQDFGSGSPDKPEPELREKTLRVTFLMMEPYISAYSNRDSPEFLNISRSLANAVDLLFDNLPGTQRSSLVRIQSLVMDDFLCKVTLDIMTTGYDDTDKIKDILRNHIKNNGRLGVTSVQDGDFSAQLIDPGTTLYCEDSEFKCDEDLCLPMSSKCDGRWDCSDGTDELDCADITTPRPVDQEIPDDYGNTITDKDDQSPDNDQNPDNENPYAATPTDQNPDDQNPYNQTPNNPYDQNPEQNPYGQTADDRYPVNTTSEAPSSSLDQDSGFWPDSRGDLGEARTEPAPYVCPENHMRCDDTRCVENDRRCDGYNDCDDGADEAGCPDASRHTSSVAAPPPSQRRTEFSTTTERFLRVEEQQLEIQRLNAQILQSFLERSAERERAMDERSAERDRILAKAVAAVGKGLQALAEAINRNRV